MQVLRVSMEEQRQRQEDEARRAHQLQESSQATAGQEGGWGRMEREGWWWDREGGSKGRGSVGKGRDKIEDRICGKKITELSVIEWYAFSFIYCCCPLRRCWYWRWSVSPGGVGQSSLQPSKQPFKLPSTFLIVCRSPKNGNGIFNMILVQGQRSNYCYS